MQLYSKGHYQPQPHRVDVGKFLVYSGYSDFKFFCHEWFDTGGYNSRSRPRWLKRKLLPQTSWFGTCSI
jgi:hypothetical protein